MIGLWSSAKIVITFFVWPEKNCGSYNSMSPSNIIKVVPCSPQGNREKRERERERRNKRCREDYTEPTSKWRKHQQGKKKKNFKVVPETVVMDWFSKPWVGAYMKKIHITWFKHARRWFTNQKCSLANETEGHIYELFSYIFTVVSVEMDNFKMPM